MTDAEIQAEIAKQIRDKLALLATKLRDTAQHHGPVIAKTLNLLPARSTNSREPPHLPVSRGIHGRLGSFLKYGLDTQEDALVRGETPGGSGWGGDPELGTLVIPEDGHMSSVQMPSIPGNYLLYYEAIRDSMLHGAPNPVPPQQAVAVMTVLAMASESARRGRELSWQEPLEARGHSRSSGR